jgi:hypothetical protein
MPTRQKLQVLNKRKMQKEAWNLTASAKRSLYSSHISRLSVGHLVAKNHKTYPGYAQNLWPARCKIKRHAAVTTWRMRFAGRKQSTGAAATSPMQLGCMHWQLLNSNKQKIQRELGALSLEA